MSFSCFSLVIVIVLPFLIGLEVCRNSEILCSPAEKCCSWTHSVLEMGTEAKIGGITEKFTLDPCQGPKQ